MSDVSRAEGPMAYVEGVGEVPIVYVTDDAEEEMPLPPLPGSAVAAIEPSVCWALVGDGMVVFDHRTATTYVLNEMAGLVWQCLDGVSTLAEIAADIADEFHVDRGQTLAEVRDAASVFFYSGVVHAEGHDLTVPPLDLVVTSEFLVDPPDD